VTEQLAQTDPCRRADAAAYLDGELNAAETSHFEEHLKNCPPCSALLLEQRRLLCLLDTAFDDKTGSAVALPADFARVVTARAQTDMHGVRRRSEHRLAFKICVALAAAAFALLGAAASEMVLTPLFGAARAVGSILGMVGHTLVNAGAGAALILRALGGRLVAEPQPLKYLQWALLAGAALLLLRLIGNYHRARINDQENF
jgi:anti-sigma factor RsiW